VTSEAIDPAFDRAAFAAIGLVERTALDLKAEVRGGRWTTSLAVRPRQSTKNDPGGVADRLAAREPHFPPTTRGAGLPRLLTDVPTSAPGFRRSASSTAGQEVRPVSISARPSTASQAPSGACSHPGRTCGGRLGPSNSRLPCAQGETPKPAPVIKGGLRVVRAVVRRGACRVRARSG
jgi:hypothetical protein